MVLGGYLKFQDKWLHTAPLSPRKAQDVEGSFGFWKKLIVPCTWTMPWVFMLFPKITNFSCCLLETWTSPRWAQQLFFMILSSSSVPSQGFLTLCMQWVQTRIWMKAQGALSADLQSCLCEPLYFPRSCLLPSTLAYHCGCSEGSHHPGRGTDLTQQE